MTNDQSDSIDHGVVIIGRNEGERLRECIQSVTRAGVSIVYVDSGSSDGSVALAESLGIAVVILSTAAGFTAARARNAGFERLATDRPAMRFVQFVDGDCVVAAGWLAAARAAFDLFPTAAIVCGRRRERFPDASIYNRLCDLEWNTPIGQASECGGDAMMRVEAFRAVGGFDGTLIAGEEPELCVRLRTAGWAVERIDAEMTLHDAAMTRFGQWWNRNVRAGHAFAQGSALHGRSPLKHWTRQTRSNWLWGCAMPLLGLVFAWPTRGISLLAWLILIGLMTGKVFANAIRRKLSARDAALVAPFTMIGKIPQAIGQIRFTASRWLGHRSKLIEYKSSSPGVVSG